MKKLLSFLLTTLSLMAIELPTPVGTTIKTNHRGAVQLTQNVQKGMSGIVVHRYGNGLSAITNTIIAHGGNRATLAPYSLLSHERLPTIKTEAKEGDKAIFGNLYNNVMLIAPNEQSYSQITKSIKRSWIHPDIYASYLINHNATEISLDNIRDFAIKNQVGLVLIATQNSLLILDPISKAYLSKLPLNLSNKKAQSPFYARFEQIDSGAFSMSDVVPFAEYYQGINQLK
jgi:hypothetical protein